MVAHVRGVVVAQTKIHVDIKKKVEDIKLVDTPSDCLPLPVPTDKLANLRAKQIKAAGDMPIRPFPYMEIDEFLPAWAKESQGTSAVACATADDASQAAIAKGKRRLDLPKWVAAFENMALASAACGIWQYTAAKAHLRVCLEIAGEVPSVLVFDSLSAALLSSCAQARQGTPLPNSTTRCVVKNGPIGPSEEMPTLMSM